MAEQIIITLPLVIDNESVMMPVVCCDGDASLPVCPAGAGVQRGSIFTLLDE